MTIDIHSDDAGGDLAALLGSRICHDLISPIGAIANGMELLSMSSAANSAEMALISESVAAANARIRFFRVAFGQASAGQTISLAELLSITDDLSRGSRTRISWTGGATVGRDRAKAIFLALLCLETAMPWGGEVTIMNGTPGWSVTGKAPRLKEDPPLWQGLATGLMPETLSAAQIQFSLLATAAQRQGKRIAVTRSDGEIALSL